jgi:hypothetical protein
LLVNNTFTTLPQTFTNIHDVVVNGDNIVVADINTVYSYSLNGGLIGNVSVGEECNTATRINSKFIVEQNFRV